MHAMQETLSYVWNVVCDVAWFNYLISSEEIPSEIPQASQGLVDVEKEAKR